MLIDRIKEIIHQHRPVVVVMGIILALTTIPVTEVFLVLGSSWWHVIPPTFTDETFYYARVQTILKGHVTEGNPYFLEHSDGPPLVIFAGAWINAIPQLAGIPFNTAVLVNFMVWSLLFAVSLYWLFRELYVPPWIAVFGTVLLYIQSYAHVWRAVNLQTVYPFYFLFYIALARFIHEQSRRNVIFVALMTGATFYLFAYLWQAILITLGLLFLYALIWRNRSLLWATCCATLLGIIIGLPVPLYALWLSHTSAYFWESVGRLGLVNTHLPMAEIIYSGGWIGVVLVFLALLYWRAQAMWNEREFRFLALFLTISGLGLWSMQGSNLITGKLLETGEHIRLLILPWLVCATAALGVFLWKERAQLSGGLRVCSIIVIGILSVVNVCYTYQYFSPFILANVDRETWQIDQLYAKRFAWLDKEEKNPVVVWSDPHDNVTTYLPIFTKDFTLYAWAGMMELVPEGEIRERYLVSQYFNNPTVADLTSEGEMDLYLGRRDFPHQAMTIGREVKICHLLFFWDKNKDCGVIPTPQSLLGDQFFADLEIKFRTDIKPNIKAYLSKYHVSYILKDKVLDPLYHPETLRAKLVYEDARYELWKL